MPSAVGFVLKGYPRLSETFVAQEIRALEQRGLAIRIYSLRHPTDRATHPVNAEIVAPVCYLPEYLHQEPARTLRAWRAARREPGYAAAYRAWRADLARDRTRNRVRRFGQALVLAHELAPDIDRLHAHFLHTPASVTRYAAMIRGLPWSVSAHAKDIWTSPEWEIAEKLADCAWATTCTATNQRHLASLAPAGRVSLDYHGLDLNRFPPPQDRRAARDGSDPGDPVRLLSVGRAVEKKGYDDLLAALAALPEGIAWRLDHIGGGERLAHLKADAAARGIADRITWRGSQPQQIVAEAYRDADLFVLACREAANGDRDGLPNVLMEAQSQGLPVLSTRFSAVPELIENEVTGQLVEPGDRQALSAAIGAMVAAPELRARLGQAGQDRVRSRFALEQCIGGLASRFGVARAAA
jgi:glycosyltransferase involved in cell wall biosynthesis